MIFRASHIQFDSLRWKTVKISPMFWIVKCTLCAFPLELEPGLLDTESNGNFPADFPMRRIGLFVCLYSADLYISLPYMLRLMKETGTGVERHDMNRWAWKRRLHLFIYFFRLAQKNSFLFYSAWDFAGRRCLQVLEQPIEKLFPFSILKWFKNYFSLPASH